MLPVVTSGTMLQCSFGNIPTPINALPDTQVMAQTPVATTNSHIPLVNILPFGMCSNPANPMVAAATVAAMGVLTPMPCIPCTVSSWEDGCSNVKCKGNEILNMSSKLSCAYGGEIKVAIPLPHMVMS